MDQTKSLRNPLLFNECVINKRYVSLEEVSFHDTIGDCWIVIYDHVYDVSTFLDEHPGGREILLEYAGRDASCAFRSTGHSKVAIYALKRYYVGELPIEERIFRKVGGYALIDLS
ncbi:hypothetical protein RN001_007143 [Aquatica leii]|uniref:Cytochrome b5 heme-binding domain-containing protein n=1 Tax=Aquatica leii TaxID=1421715 RepID=A0AAN7P7Z3_9COLE|nr:hypothetical protein RN001_007143 [Aquatica leii]